jgi:succinate-semialdehyde dehydrogenase/glutarate-semialdehyde dehydrogenase
LALANSRRLEAVQNLIDEVLALGGKSVSVGGGFGTVGNFLRPTLLTDLSPDARAMNSEPFGPVALACRFLTPEEAIAEANRVPFGLAAYAFTRAAATAAFVSEELQAGGIGINTFSVSLIEAPFGGVKDSGYGLEGGAGGLESYLHSRFIHHA